MEPSVHRGCFVLVILLFVGGCHRSTNEAPLTTPGENDSPLIRLQAAVQTQDWVKAQRLTHEVLLRHPGNADALQLVAQVAHGNGELDVAADLMSDACRAESYADSARTRQAVAAMLAAGRLFDAIELLESSVNLHPDQHALRSMLYQMHWGVEDRPQSLRHGRYLIKQRQFDVNLLVAMSSVELREESSDSLVEMANRNENDKRPLIAEARRQFDARNLDKAAELLRTTMQNHPDYPPAVALLARALVDGGQEKELITLVERAPSEANLHPFFWLAKGDWCARKQKRSQATRAYWEATLRDPDLRVSWLKLNQSLQQIGQKVSGLNANQADAVSQRVVLLTQLSQARAEFLESDRSSAELAIRVAKTLQALGRLWEAEAWASIATLLSNMNSTSDDSAAISETRQSIITHLRKNSPWQDIQSHEELRLDLTHLPLPEITRSVGSDSPAKRSDRLSGIRAMPILLVDQAAKRSLRFFGRTGDQLSEPGVLFYQTLGCGGGTLDFDLDGWSDLYLAAAGGRPPARDSQSNALWRNLHGTFQEITIESGSADSGFGQGIAVGDVNEDGFPDLLVMNYGRNSLFSNNGDGTFSDASQSLGKTNLESEWSSSGAIADIDGDGFADVTILNYGVGFDAVTRQCLHSRTNIARACSPLTFPGAADRFLLSSGQISPALALLDRTSQYGDPSVIGRGLGLIVGPLGDKSRLGIFIANDMTSNHYWSREPKNDPATGDSGAGDSAVGQTVLVETAMLRGLASDDRTLAQGSMGIAAADLDRDGDLDLYVTNFKNEPNTYHEGINGGLYRDQTTSQRLDVPSLPMVGFGTEAVDFDNNGVLELVVLNGHVDDYPNEFEPDYAQPMQVFQRQLDGSFASVGESIGGNYLPNKHIGRALWTIDADRDGRTDLVTTHQTEPVALLMNQTDNAGNWISFKLTGKSSSRDAIGSRIDLQCDDFTATAFMLAGHGYLCSNEPIIHFGLADKQQPCRVTVTWPDGTTDAFSDLNINEQWLLVQDSDDAFELR